jgi:hypothetical protein
MTDNELIANFEALRLPNDSFHHAEHVRLAFLYLCRYPPLEALDRFTSGLKNLADANGKSERYHHTITCAFLFLIGDRIARAGPPQTWPEFMDRNPDLMNWQNSILKKYYRDETLSSALARTTFLFPDISA